MADILLTEDDVNIAKIYRKWLESDGHVVTWLENGYKGFNSAIFAGIPDLLVTDIMMPETDGEELTASFSVIAEGRPVVVVSACTDERKLESICQQDNVKALLKKPVTKDQLLAAVREAL